MKSYLIRIQQCFDKYIHRLRILKNSFYAPTTITHHHSITVSQFDSYRKIANGRRAGWKKKNGYIRLACLADKASDWAV